MYDFYADELGTLHVFEILSIDFISCFQKFILVILELLFCRVQYIKIAQKIRLDLFSWFRQNNVVLLGVPFDAPGHKTGKARTKHKNTLQS